MNSTDTTIVNMFEAKTNLSKLVARVQNGERIILAKNGTPVAALVVEHPRREKARIGAWASDRTVMIPDNFDDPDPEIAAMFEKSHIFPDTDSRYQGV